jgi:hypothetical protein
MQWSLPASRIKRAVPTTDGVDQYRPGTLFDVTKLKSSAILITDVSPDSFNAYRCSPSVHSDAVTLEAFGSRVR